MKKLLLFGVTLLLCIPMLSQISFHWEPFLHQWEESDPAELQALNGYITWKLYVEIPELGDPNVPEFVTSLVGDASDDNFLPVNITFQDSMFSCCPFQSDLGGPLASDLNPNVAALPGFADLTYDSYFTIGVENADNEGAECLSSLPGGGLAEFESCEVSGWQTSNGGIFQLNTPDTCPLGIPDENNRVFIAQLTLPQGCELVVPATLCVQYFIDGLQDEDSSVVECVVITEPDMCFNNPIFHSVDSVANALCYGDSTGLVLVDYFGGSGDLSAYLDVDTENEGDEILEEFFESVPAGSYLLTVQDNQFNDADGNACMVTDTIEILQPDSLSLSLEVLQNVICDGDSTGVIQITGSGGTAPYTAWSSFGTEEFSDTLINFSFDSLDITDGSILFEVQDFHGCLVQDSVLLGPIGEFEVAIDSTNLSCFQSLDGIINVTVTTDSEVINTSWTAESEIPDGTLIATNLPAGSYVVHIDDLVHCPFTSDTIYISEPEPIVLDSLIVLPPGCGGECTATVTALASGGVGEYVYSWNEASPETETADGLCAGENSLVITDSQNCSQEETFQIEEPEEIQIVINATNVTCTGMCDGSFQIAALGIEPLEITFPEVPNVDVCEGNYPVFVTDGIGCSATDTVHISADLISDMQTSVFTTPVSCWNEADGTATIAVLGGNGNISYEWNDPLDQSSATAIGLVEDTYVVTISDQVGCTLSETVVIEPNENCFYIANALTPNGDGFNDSWVLGGLEYHPESLVQVFNRWGQQVFGSSGIYTGWDGTYNSLRLPAADYYYVISVDSNSEPLTGTVTIKY